MKSGVLGVASLTVAERLLAYGGNNEALASLKPTLAKPGYGALVFKDGAKLALPKGFDYVALRPRRHADVRRPADADLPRRQRLLLRRQGQGLDRPQPGGLPARPRARAPSTPTTRIAQGGVTVSHFNTRPGKVLGNALVLNGTDNNCNGGATPWGTWLTGEENTVGSRAGLRRRARLRVRGRRARDLDGRAGADQGDGPLRPRGLPGRPEDRDRLHDRGQRRPGRRLLPLPARPQGQAPPRRQAADARDQGPAEVQHRHEPDGRREARVPLGRRSRTPTPTAPTASRRPSTCRAARRRREVHGPRGRHLLEGQLLLHGLRRRQPGAGPDLELHARQQELQARHARARLRVAAATGCSPAPTRSRSSPRGGILVCEDGDERGRRRPAVADEVHLAERRAARLRQGDRADAAARPHRGGPVPVQPATAGTTRPRRARASAAARSPGVGFSPDGKWLFCHIQYPGESFAITGPWHKGWL